MKTLADLTTPAEIAPKRMLEKDVQKKCVDWARANGWWARKFSSQSQRSVPDYLFAKMYLNEAGAPKRRRRFACEFKAPGKTSTAAQIDEQNAMRLAGWTVIECDDFMTFQAFVNEIDFVATL